MNTMRRLTAIFIGLVAVSIVKAQDRSAFQNLDSFSDIFVTASPNNPLTFVLSLGLTPTIKLNGKTYGVAYAWGFYALSNDLGNLDSSAGQENVWDYVESNNDVAGWQNLNRKHKINPGQSLAFTFDAIEKDQIDVFGTALQLNRDGGIGKPVYVALVVAEPSTVAASLAGFVALGAAFRRRKRS